MPDGKSCTVVQDVLDNFVFHMLDDCNDEDDDDEEQVESRSVTASTDANGNLNGFTDDENKFHPKAIEGCQADWQPNPIADQTVGRYSYKGVNEETGEDEWQIIEIEQGDCGDTFIAYGTDDDEGELPCKVV